jgi:hypothetical protein
MTSENSVLNIRIVLNNFSPIDILKVMYVSLRVNQSFNLSHLNVIGSDQTIIRKILQYRIS